MKATLNLRLLLGLAMFAGIGWAMPARATPAALILVVTNGGDARDINPGDGVCETYPGNDLCTLRAAVMEANARPGADTIHIPEMTVTLTFQATPFEDTALDGDLDITDDLTVVGAGQTKTIVDGNRAETGARVFTIMEGVSVALINLTIRNGTNESGSGIVGGVLNDGTLNMDHVTVTANDWGGIDNHGSARLNYVSITENLSSGLMNNYGSVLISNSTISGNVRSGSGAGIFSVGELTMINSTLSKNRALGGSVGGGLAVHDGTTTIINSTISGNQTDGQGGGIYVGSSLGGAGATLNLHNVTVAHNRADHDNDGWGAGGGVYASVDETAGPVVVNVSNSLLANNFRHLVFAESDDCSGVLTSAGYNLIRTLAGCSVIGIVTGNLSGVNPLLGALAAQGGATPTHALGFTSPAIGAGNPTGCDDNLGEALTTDQRGYFRTTAGRCDIGAYEYLAEPPVLIFLPLAGR